jgi:hypothetical protein
MAKKIDFRAAFPATPVDSFITDLTGCLWDLVDQVTHEITRGENAQVEAENSGHHWCQIVSMFFSVRCSCGHIDFSSNMSKSW